MSEGLSEVEEKFDYVVAFGGPLSYTFEKEQIAMRGMLRTCRGLVLCSVMSLDGMLGWYKEHRPEYLDEMPEEVRREFIKTGDMRPWPAKSGHACRQFRTERLRELVARTGGEMVAMAASNYYSMHKPYEQVLADVAESEPAPALEALYDMEYDACREYPDHGTHILFAARPLQG